MLLRTNITRMTKDTRNDCYSRKGTIALKSRKLRSCFMMSSLGNEESGTGKKTEDGS
jgi:hypothetical protein